MITLLRWRKTKTNGRNNDVVVKTAAATPTRNIPALPLEIIDKILQETCELPPRVADRKVLSACAVVCKSWLPFAQRFLYHTLTVENNRIDVSRTPGTLGPLTLFKRSHLLGFTRSLAVPVVDDDEESEENTLQHDELEEGIPSTHPECVPIAEFLYLLAHTPGLRHLRLSVVWSRKSRCSFKPSKLDWLSSLPLPIEVLDLKYGRPFHSPLVCDLVRIWPTLRALRVRTDYGLPLPERPSARLRELRLPITSLAAVIEWFLPPIAQHDRSDLRILELYEIPEGRHTLLSAHASAVSSLTLSRQPATGIADMFTNLEELVIAGPFWSAPLPTLPKTLMHIRLQVHAFISDTVLLSITAALASLGNLRALSVEEALVMDKGYPALRQMCEANRVEILVNPMNPLLAETVHPYFTEMDRFPRQHTFAEFFGLER